jgi:hypothetical protein
LIIQNTFLFTRSIELSELTQGQGYPYQNQQLDTPFPKTQLELIPSPSKMTHDKLDSDMEDWGLLEEETESLKLPSDPLITPPIQANKLYEQMLKEPLIKLEPSMISSENVFRSQETPSKIMVDASTFTDHSDSGSTGNFMFTCLVGC